MANNRDKPRPPRGQRCFFILRGPDGNVWGEGARFSDGAVVTRHLLTGQTYPHNTLGDAKRVHVGMDFERMG